MVVQRRYGRTDYGACNLGRGERGKVWVLLDILRPKSRTIDDVTMTNGDYPGSFWPGGFPP